MHDAARPSFAIRIQAGGSNYISIEVKNMGGPAGEVVFSGSSFFHDFEPAHIPYIERDGNAFISIMTNFDPYKNVEIESEKNLWVSIGFKFSANFSDEQVFDYLSTGEKGLLGHFIKR